MKTPIFDTLRKYVEERPVAFHMPGHKMGKGIPDYFKEDLLSLDVTEIKGTDNLHYPESDIKEAMERAAKVFGAEETFFLVNGSSCGILSAINGCINEGDEIIAGRDCHKSLINALMLAGGRAIFIKPGFIGEFSIPEAITYQQIEQAIQKNPNAKVVFLTRPNYYGICCDVKSIGELVHKNNMILIIDEAHGAHLSFSDELPQSAIQLGADICIQSAHKTLPALTQSAFLHIKKGRINLEKIKFYLTVFQTTSPSYILMAFLDIARAIMEEKGKILMQNLISNIKSLKDEINDIEGIKILNQCHLNSGKIDVTRIVINSTKLGLTGFQLEEILRYEYSIQVEMSDLNNIVLITTVADDVESFKILSNALKTIDSKSIVSGNKNIIKNNNISNFDIEIPVQKVDYKTSINAVGKVVSLESSKDMISKGMITPYPPGVPVLCPGEEITAEIIDYLIKVYKAGGSINGIKDGLKIEVI